MGYFGPCKDLLAGLLGLVTITAVLSDYGSISHDGYIGAVLEYEPNEPIDLYNVNRAMALSVIKSNMRIYKSKAREADIRHSDIIVFPEYGLFGVFNDRTPNIRDYISPFLETIPSVGRKRWIPCNNTSLDEDQYYIQISLSCLAERHNMIVVASLGEKARCTRGRDYTCPNKGYYQFITTVVYSKEGAFIAKYRRSALLHEPYFDSPNQSEIATFESSSGIKFGIVSSYDTIVEEPMKELIQKQGIKNIIIPNVWRAESPLLSSAQWHSSLAKRFNINILAATVHDSSIKSYGTGIYLQSGLSYTYIDTESSRHGEKKKFLIAKNVEVTNEYSKSTYINTPRLQLIRDKYTYETVKILGQEVNFKFVDLKNYKNVSVCSGHFCCKVEHSPNALNRDRYGLGVFKGFIKAFGKKLSFEICTVMKCQDRCGMMILNPTTYFRNFGLYGYNFTTDEIYPHMLFQDYQMKSILSPKWQYEGGKIKMDNMDDALQAATLLGRVYREDKSLTRYQGATRYSNSGSYRKGSASISKFTLSAIVVSIVSAISLISMASS
ncbi:vascular non-inflammatory molecule 3-like [Argonauta hians]